MAQNIFDDCVYLNMNYFGEWIKSKGNGNADSPLILIHVAKN
jgi:hypothetical protein